METDNKPLIDLVVDDNSRRPFCVIIQACYGTGASNSFLQETFRSELWLTAPTDKPRLVSGTKEQWENHAKWLENQKV